MASSVTFAGISCEKTPAPTQQEFGALDVDVVGCRAIVSRGGSSTGDLKSACELPDNRSVRLVLPDRTTDVHVSIGSLGGGNTLTLPENHTDGDVTITATGLGNVRLRHVLRVASSVKMPWLEEAKAARAKSDLDKATALATEHARDQDANAAALAKGLLARIALSRGRADEAFPLFKEAIALDRQAGRLSDAADDSFAYAFALHQRSQRYAEARAAIEAIGKETLAAYPEGRARDRYYRGVLAAETGDRRQAIRLLREAQVAAHRIAMTKLERNTRGAIALEMQAIGHAEESLTLLKTLEEELDAAAAVTNANAADTPTPCERAEVANNRGWGALLVSEAASARGDNSARSTTFAEEASKSLQTSLEFACSDPYVRGFALANLARNELDLGGAKAAAKHLAEARAGIKEPRGTERIAWMLLEARIHLASARHEEEKEALRVIDEARVLARASALRLDEWSLLTARGEVLEALGRTKDAIDALKLAEDVLDDATLLVPLGEGRSGFVGGARSVSARLLVGLLAKTKQYREAAAAGRHAQSRVLSSVERGLRLERLEPADRSKWERAVQDFRAGRTAIDAEAANDWKLPADALARVTEDRSKREQVLRAALESAVSLLSLGSQQQAQQPTSPSPPPPPLAGVLELDIYPDRQGFLAIAIDSHNATSHRVPTPHDPVDAKVLGHALFDPIDAQIHEAEVVRIRAYGPWRAVDVHSLPFKGERGDDGEPLIAKVAVDYALGLRAATPARAAAQSERLSPLIIGDPSGDLPGAFEEAKQAFTLLGGDAGAQPAMLLRDQATSATVTAALRETNHVHYAGHGIFAGAEGWESALPLAAGGRLTIGDVLALAPAPSTVILTGCEAARSAAGETEGLGIAQAFLVAGTSAVLAPVRKVPDDLATNLTAALYKNDNPTAPTSSSSALAVQARKAILTLRKSNPTADWSAFRVIVP